MKPLWLQWLILAVLLINLVIQGWINAKMGDMQEAYDEFQHRYEARDQQIADQLKGLTRRLLR